MAVGNGGGEESRYGRNWLQSVNLTVYLAKVAIRGANITHQITQPPTHLQGNQKETPTSEIT